VLSHDFSERLEISQAQDAVSSENLWETLRKESAKLGSIPIMPLIIIFTLISFTFELDCRPCCHRGRHTDEVVCSIRHMNCWNTILWTWFYEKMLTMMLNIVFVLVWYPNVMNEDCNYCVNNIRAAAADNGTGRRHQIRRWVDEWVRLAITSPCPTLLTFFVSTVTLTNWKGQLVWQHH